MIRSTVSKSKEFTNGESKNAICDEFIGEYEACTNLCKVEKWFYFVSNTLENRSTNRPSNCKKSKDNLHDQCVQYEFPFYLNL